MRGFGEDGLRAPQVAALLALAEGAALRGQSAGLGPGAAVWTRVPIMATRQHSCQAGAPVNVAMPGLLAVPSLAAEEGNEVKVLAWTRGSDRLDDPAGSSIEVRRPRRRFA